MLTGLLMVIVLLFVTGAVEVVSSSAIKTENVEWYWGKSEPEWTSEDAERIRSRVEEFIRAGRGKGSFLFETRYVIQFTLPYWLR